MSTLRSKIVRVLGITWLVQCSLAFVAPCHTTHHLKVRSSPLPKPHTAEDSPSTRLQVFSRTAARSSTTLAGRIWPILAKFHHAPSLAPEIWGNIRAISRWQDLLLLSVLAFGTQPLSNLFHERIKVDRHLGVAQILSQAGKIALSVYVVDVFCVFLSTLGFTFPAKFALNSAYAKITYSVWALRKFLVYKRRVLCRMSKVDEENMGRVEVLDRFVDGLSISVTALFLLEWMSVKIGSAITGIFAFGSVGTLAFTLGSQRLIAQLLSGLTLALGNKLYVGDIVTFGDGTSGKVIRMGWMDTVFRSGDETMQSVPNALLSEQKISNLSRIRQSQVKQTLRFHLSDTEKIPMLVDTIREEIKASCPRLITDGTRPFRVFWTAFCEDHLEVEVITHHMIAPIGDAYFKNRQEVLMAIARSVKKCDMEFATLATLAYGSGEPEWRVVPPTTSVRTPDDSHGQETSSEPPVESSEQEKSS